MVKKQIQEMIDRETMAWDNKDVNLLLSIFHPDFIWPWPNHPNDHDPILWVIPQGKFNRTRWTQIYTDIFKNHELVHNHRNTRSIIVSKEEDAGFAVVDIDTLWRNKITNENWNWKGRVGKGYSLCQNQWKLIYHTGVLTYQNNSLPLKA